MGEAGLDGTAVIAGVGAKLFTDYQEPIRKAMTGGKPLLPGMERNAIYASYAQAYLKAIETLTPLYGNFFLT